MTKIAILKKNFRSPGGLEKYTWRLAKAFALRGAEVSILSADPTTPPDPNISFVHLPLSSLMGFRQIQEFDLKCRKHLEMNHYDIIFGMDRNRHQSHIRAGSGVHAAYLKQRGLTDSFFKRLTSPLNPLNSVILNIEKEAFESPELKVLFTNSHMVKGEILNYYRTPPEKIEVVHNGVEWKEMEKDFATWVESKSRLSHQFHLDPSTFNFLFVGHGYRRKGLPELLSALALLPTRDFHLSVVGRDKNAATYQALATRLGLKNNVTFFGSQKDPRPFYQICDALVIPSFYDPFANVTVEALAMGLYTLSSKYNGGYEIIKSTMGGIIPSLTDRESFADALQEALSHPKTWIRSQNIRAAVQYLDFPNQLMQIVNRCMKL